MIDIHLKSVHFKKTVAQISFLSKLWYFQYKSKSATILKETRFAQLFSQNERTLMVKFLPIYLVSWRCESFPSLWRLRFSGNSTFNDDIFSIRPISSGQAQNADLLRPGNGNTQIAKVVCRK